jgi:DNA invertase Pin-like site-specific DNA recombinase
MDALPSSMGVAISRAMHSPSFSRIGIYARYSSDIQNPSSVDDQVRLCRDLIADQFDGDPQILVFKDAAISGATMDRPGMTRLMEAAKAGRINLVVAEGLDRLSRSLKDIAAIHETLGYYGVTIWTAHEGRITELHVGLKGTMNALYLKDMKDKIRRGQSARVAAGYASSSCSYGYRVVRGVVDAKGRNVNGIREIEESQAAIVRRIFREYADGRLLPEIIEGLNRDNVPAPAGGFWKRTALAGSPKKREGILLNEVYIGNLVYNRTRIVRDPATNKRCYVANPEEDWTRAHLPELRIIDDALWQQAQTLYRHRRAERSIKAMAKKKPQPRILDTHNQHAMTGWVKCGWCGGQKSLANDSRYVCSTHRYAKKCRNSRGIKEPVLMEATFQTLRDRIRNGPDYRDRFVRAFAREMQANEKLQTEAGDLKARIDRLMAVIERGIDTEHVTDRILALQDELDQVRVKMRLDAPPPLPGEPMIRTILLAAVDAIELSGDVVRQRILFKCVLKAITLTPVQNQRSGETAEIMLREEGWPDFWRIAASDS